MLPWQDKALEATHGKHSQIGAILVAAFFAPGHDTNRPRFEGKAFYTSDGFLQCDFVTTGGEHKHGAFVGSWTDLWNNAVRLCDHLELTVEDRRSLLHAVKTWVRWN